MQISKNSVVSVHYTLKDQAGEVIDSSLGSSPMVYIHGTGAMIPGFELALAGRAVGEKIKFTVEPEHGYGPRDNALLHTVPKSSFPSPDDVKEGDQFQAQSDHGPVAVTVVEVKDSEVVIDGNHPLAGHTLNFEVEIMELREATAEELAHGHVHGEGCDH